MNHKLWWIYFREGAILDGLRVVNPSSGRFQTLFLKRCIFWYQNFESYAVVLKKTVFRCPSLDKDLNGRDFSLEKGWFRCFRPWKRPVFRYFRFLVNDWVTPLLISRNYVAPSLSDEMVRCNVFRSFVKSLILIGRCSLAFEYTLVSIRQSPECVSEPRGSEKISRN